MLRFILGLILSAHLTKAPQGVVQTCKVINSKETIKVVKCIPWGYVTDEELKKITILEPSDGCYTYEIPKPEVICK